MAESEKPESVGDSEGGGEEVEQTRAEAESELEHRKGLQHLVSEIKSIETQVGEHVIAALQQNDTVAVLTAVLPSGAGGQRIASVPLDQDLWMSVQTLLAQAGEERAGEVPCVGFQCVLEQRRREEGPPPNPASSPPASPPDNV
jgi:hypothetical protein